jgi:CBS domain-containing protein
MSGSHSPSHGASAGPGEDPTVGRLLRVPVTTVEPDAHLASAAYLMKHAGNGALVVTEDDEARLPIAIITDADVTRAVADGRDLNNTRINQLRLPQPVAVSSDTSVTEAAERMLDQGLHHLPVVDDGRLTGLIDIATLCGALLRPARTA